MTRYDAITDQFTPNLSDHAKHLYAAIFDGCQRAGGAYIAGWDLPEEFGDLDVVCGGPADQAKAALIAAGLIQEVPNLGCRYQPTAVAWRAHLRAEQQRHNDALAAQRALRQVWQHSAFDQRQFASIADVPGLLEPNAAA